MRHSIAYPVSFFVTGFGVAVCLFHAVPTTAQISDTTRIPAGDSTSKITSDSLPKHIKDSLTKSGFVGAPYVQYAPETGWAGGLVGFYYFHLSEDTLPSDTRALRTLPSDVSGGAMYSQKHQSFIGILYDLYFKHDYHLSGGLHYEQYPLDFYGVGNYNPVSPIDSYTPTKLGADFIFTRNISRSLTGEGFNAGILGEFRHDDVRKSDSGGLIATGKEPGAHGGNSNGLGVIALFDSRDNIYSTQNGEYDDLEAEFYGRSLGSDFTFNRYTLDLRRFIPLAKDQTFATQLYAQFVNGNEPFYEMQGLGGDSKIRGYYLLRFRENDVILLQTEYRFPIWWRIGGAVFAGGGEVGHVLSDFTSHSIHPSAGIGLRFLVVPEQHLSIRIDYGIGTDVRALYLSLLEAF
jgi:outer membrane protein assembly factor BamA